MIAGLRRTALAVGFLLVAVSFTTLPQKTAAAPAPAGGPAQKTASAPTTAVAAAAAAADQAASSAGAAATAVPPQAFNQPDAGAGLSPAAGRRFLPVNGKPAFLAYAKGLTDSFDLVLYRELGFTSLVVDVPWKAEPDYGPADIMIRSAGRLGIGAIIQLHPGEPPASLNLRVDPANPEYQKAVLSYLGDAGRHFRSIPGVDAVLFEDDSEQHVHVDDGGFREFLSRIYHDVRDLNKAWGTSLSSMNQVTMDAACRMSLEQYGGLSVPCLQVGEYRSGAYSSLLAAWARDLHEADPVPALIMGRQDLPRSAVLTPPLAAGVVVAAALPGVAPVDVARRGGRFAAIAEVSGFESQHFEVLNSYLVDCVLHGAGGVAFPSWPAIMADRRLQEPLKLLLHKLSTCAGALQPPTPSFAVVYEPLAPGTPEGGPSAPFGYMPHPSDSEPGALIEALSRGSAYGFADVLAIEDLAVMPLSRYRVLFLPSCFIVPPEAARALDRYVRDGGVVVADLGLDLGDLDRLESPWTSAMAGLFGLPATRPVQFGKYEYPAASGRKGKLFGGFSWYPLVGRPDLFPGLTDNIARAFEASPAPYSGPRALAPNSQNLSVFGLSSTSHEGDLIGGVFVRRLGQGSSIFATFRLWSEWSTDSELFSLVNWGLVARSAAAALASTTGPLSTVRFTPIENDGFQLTQDGPESVITAVKLQGAPLRLRTGCIVRNLPSDPPSALAFVLLSPQEPVVCRAVPVVVAPQDGYATTAVDEYSPTAIRLKICGNGSSVRAADGRLHLVPGDSVEATITIRYGDYPVASGSRHEALITDLRPGGATRRVVLLAGADGMLSFSWRFAASSVEIRPIPAGE